MAFDQSRRNLPRRHINLLERQSFVAFDEESRIAMHRGKKRNIVGEVGRCVGDEEKLVAEAFDGPDLDRSARTGDQIIGGFQAQIER